MFRESLPSEGDLDGRGQAGGEKVRWEVRVHGQQLTGLAGSQLDTVLHGGGKGHLGERVAWIDGRHLDTTNIKVHICIHLAATDADKRTR